MITLSPYTILEVVPTPSFDKTLLIFASYACHVSTPDGLGKAVANPIALSLMQFVVFNVVVSFAFLFAISCFLLFLTENLAEVE